jgi:hypothetical protein
MPELLELRERHPHRHREPVPPCEERGPELLLCEEPGHAQLLEAESPEEVSVPEREVPCPSADAGPGHNHR